MLCNRTMYMAFFMLGFCVQPTNRARHVITAANEKRIRIESSGSRHGTCYWTCYWTCHYFGASWASWAFHLLPIDRSRQELATAFSIVESCPSKNTRLTRVPRTRPLNAGGNGMNAVPWPASRVGLQDGASSGEDLSLFLGTSATG